jgi:hypothetical protein
MRKKDWLHLMAYGELVAAYEARAAQLEATK